MPEPSALVTIDDFQKLDIRVGRVISVELFPEGKHSTHLVMIDFGPEMGVRKSLARLAPRYAGPEVVGRLVLGVVNLPPRQIGKHRSEALTLGAPDADGNVALVAPDAGAVVGGRLH
jgi:tRNA-binding protein